MDDSKEPKAVTSESEGGWTSWVKEENRTFVAETSLHGVKHVGARSRSKIGRCLWLLIVLGMAGWLVFTLYSLYTRYRSYPFITSYSMNQLDSLPLPAISLCLRNPIQRSRLRHLPHSDVIEDVLMRRRWDFGNKTFRSILSRFTLQDVMEAGSFRAEEIILEASASTKSSDVKLNFITWDAPFGVFGHPVRCFTFNAMDSSGNFENIPMSPLTSWTAFLQIPTEDLLAVHDVGGIYAVIHSQSEKPSDHSHHAIDMLPGSAVTVLITKAQYRFLPAPYKSMNNRDCEQVDHPDYQSPLRHFPRYTYPSCVLEKFILGLVDMCNCTSVLIGSLKARPCTLVEHHTCFIQEAESVIMDILPECDVECSLQTLKTTWGTVRPYPTKDIIPALRVLGIMKHDSKPEELLKVTVKFDGTLLHVTEHKPELTIDDIYSRVGGQLGLFLGASLLTITELAEHLLCLLGFAIKRLLGNRFQRTASSS